MEVFLPIEIISEILTRLPADSAIRCKGICKQWRSLIDHPSFRDIHTSHVISSSPSNPKKFGKYLIPSSAASSFGFFMYVKKDGRSLEVIEYNDDDDDGGSSRDKKSKPITDNNLFQKRISNWGDHLYMSSCNGLVFMGSTSPYDCIKNKFMFICNFFTREYVNLSTATRFRFTDEEEDMRLGKMAYGFGYHPSTNEYKVVSISYDRSMPSNGKVRVYTLGSGKWRNKGEIPYQVYSSSRRSPGLFANGVIHWLTNSYVNKQIVSFDLADEEFRVVVPLLRPPSTNYADEYGVLGGCLCVTAKLEKSIDIWVLDVLTTNNNNQKKKFSWNKKFSLPWIGYSYVQPLEITKSGKISLCVDDGCTLFCYDPKTKAFVYNIVFPCDFSWGKVISYTKSFVSLKALGEEDARHWGSTSAAQADETIAQRQQQQ